MEAQDHTRARVLGLLREINRSGGIGGGVQVDIVQGMAPGNAITEAILLVAEAMESGKLIMVAKEPVLIGDLNEQEDSCSVPLCTGR